MTPAAPGVIHLATGNAGKLAELAELLDLGDRLLPPPADFPAPAEDGSTYAENALLKARALALHVGGPAIADDSGLEVDALGGRPGVHSARYAAGDGERIERLLRELRDVPRERRGARFVCALALVVPDGREEVVQGECAGSIETAARGEGGFGYDPVFVAAGQRRTFAEMSAAEKAAISHRGQAAQALVTVLKSLLP